MAGERENHPQNSESQINIIRPHIISTGPTDETMEVLAKNKYPPEVEKTGSASKELEPTYDAAAHALGLKYKRTRFGEGLAEGIRRRLTRNIKGYTVKGPEEDIKHFNRILSSAMFIANKTYENTTNEIKKHPKISTAVVAGAFAVAAFAMIEKRKKGEPYQIGPGEGTAVE